MKSIISAHWYCNPWNYSHSSNPSELKLNSMMFLWRFLSWNQMVSAKKCICSLTCILYWADILCHLFIFLFSLRCNIFVLLWLRWDLATGEMIIWKRMNGVRFSKLGNMKENLEYKSKLFNAKSIFLRGYGFFLQYLICLLIHTHICILKNDLG